MAIFHSPNTGGGGEGAPKESQKTVVQVSVFTPNLPTLKLLQESNIHINTAKLIESGIGRSMQMLDECSSATIVNKVNKSKRIAVNLNELSRNKDKAAVLRHEIDILSKNITNLLPERPTFIREIAKDVLIVRGLVSALKEKYQGHLSIEDITLIVNTVVSDGNSDLRKILYTLLLDEKTRANVNLDYMLKLVEELLAGLEEPGSSTKKTIADTQKRTMIDVGRLEPVRRGADPQDGGVIQKDPDGNIIITK